jgi:hypothetical protein
LTTRNFNRFTNPLKEHLASKRLGDKEEVETEVLKWLKQQSQDFYAVVFDTLIKRWDKCINVG